MWTHATYNSECWERYCRWRKTLTLLRSLELVRMPMVLFGCPRPSFSCLQVAVMARDTWTIKAIKGNGHTISLGWLQRTRSSLDLFWVCRYWHGEPYDTLELLWVWHTSSAFTATRRRSIYQLLYALIRIQWEKGGLIVDLFCRSSVCCRKMPQIGSFCSLLWRGPCSSYWITLVMRCVDNWATRRCYPSSHSLGTSSAFIAAGWALANAFFVARCI